MTPAASRHVVRSLLAIVAIALGTSTFAGDPIIGPPIAVDTLSGTFSANEISVSVSPVNPRDIIVGWHAYIDVFGPVRSAFSLSQDGGLTSAPPAPRAPGHRRG